MAPGGRNEHDQQVLARLPERLQPVLVAVMSQVNAQARDAQILAGQLEHHVVQLEADGPPRAGMPLDPGQRVARPGEQVNDHRPGSTRGSGNRRDVAPNQAGQPVRGALNRRAAQYPHAARIPLMRLEAIDRHVVRVTEDVAAVLLDFRQGEQLVALFAEQEPAVIGLPTGWTEFARHRSPRGNRPPQALPCPLVSVDVSGDRYSAGYSQP